MFIIVQARACHQWLKAGNYKIDQESNLSVESLKSLGINLKKVLMECSRKIGKQLHCEKYKINGFQLDHIT